MASSSLSWLMVRRHKVIWTWVLFFTIGSPSRIFMLHTIYNTISDPTSNRAGVCPSTKTRVSDTQRLYNRHTC